MEELDQRVILARSDQENTVQADSGRTLNTISRICLTRDEYSQLSWSREINANINKHRTNISSSKVGHETILVPFCGQIQSFITCDWHLLMAPSKKR